MHFKVTLCGPSLSGKSTLSRCLQSLPTLSSTLAGSFVEYHEITSFSEGYEGSHLVVLMFDLTDLDSLDETLENAKAINKVPKLLIGNKVDLVRARAVSPSLAEKVAKNLGLHYRAVTSLDPRQVEDLKELIEDILIALTTGVDRWRLRISSATHRKLKYCCKLVSVSAMVQGLILLCYGAFFFYSLYDYQQWLGDILMFGGTLTFILSFLGLYGSVFSSSRNDYSSIV